MGKDNNSKMRLRVTQASLNQTALDYGRNMANIYEAIREAVVRGSDILAFEELTLTGYEANDDFQKVDNEELLEMLDDIASYAKALDPNLIISIGHPWRYGNKNMMAEPPYQEERVKNPLYNRMDLPFNVQSFIMNGEILGMTAKMHLYNDGRGYEKRYFSEWSMEAADKLDGFFGTIEVPLDREGKRKTLLGRPIIHVKDGNRAFNLAHIICEEKWISTDFGGYPHNDVSYNWDSPVAAYRRHLTARKGTVLIIANASPPTALKIKKHEHLAKLASEYADVVIDTDGLGSSGSTFVQHGHRLIAQKGRIVYSGQRVSMGRVALSTNDVLVTPAKAQTKLHAHAKVKRPLKGKKPAIASVRKAEMKAAAWDRLDNTSREYEEVIRMTALWLFDYLKKTKGSGVAQALSGGADSAFNSVIVYAMVSLAIKELGVEGFCKEMKHLPFKNEILAAGQVSEAEAIKVAMRHMMTNVYMGTDNSSDDTKNAARTLIEGGADEKGVAFDGIGGIYEQQNIQDFLDFCAMAMAVTDSTQIEMSRKLELQKVIAEHLRLKPGSLSAEELARREAEIKAEYPEVTQLMSAANPTQLVAYENAQAALRQVLINRRANMENKRPVANPNLDEARNAYATYGGDLHSGVFNLNAHLPKAYQLKLMRYLHDHGLNGVLEPVKALGPVLRNKPTAELQPRDESGKVTQNDEDALKGSFEQLDRVAEYMLYDKVLSFGGERRLNAQEVFEHCQTDPLFEGVEDDVLYDMVMFRYQRWAISQFKIHASPYGPTMGYNVDHQSSLRTPNWSGNDQNKLVDLGVKLVFAEAAKQGVKLKGGDEVLMHKRAMQDEGFVEQFQHFLRGRDGALDFDVKRVFDRVADKGWDKAFTPLPEDHAIMVNYNLR